MVSVIVGRDKGMKGAVLKVIRDKKNKSKVKMIVSGINMRVKHKKPNHGQHVGEIIKKECLIDSSNLSLLCKSDGKNSKIAYKYLDDGKKIRMYKSSKEYVG
ncbi:MAG: 50S ribosomal protein L24 [Rickettsiaceae bacterium H1]|nr:50S ribosomal protein L24 [Rickettsiaceae bacterium H1]